MTRYQSGILLPIPQHARYFTFGIQDLDMARDCLLELGERCDGESLVVGLGTSLLSALRVTVPGLYNFPALSHQGIDIPSTPGGLWCWLRGQDRGELYHLGLDLETTLSPGFRLDDVMDAFKYQDSRDLSGYEDGTENPQGDDALNAAFVSGHGEGLDGSSYVAVQQWLHDLDYFQAMTEEEQDDMIGRRRADNTEFDEAPKSAHVKRAAQESFDPQAFILRRSMPWVENREAGLMFCAFGKSLQAYDSILRRMVGLEDNIPDALFQFSRPLTGGYYWCPPMKNGQLDLSLLRN